MSFAQIGQVRIGVNGLTCSQCTRSVEVKLRQLPFVSDVGMDLANTSGVVGLKPGVPFRPEVIAKAIRDAGFSVRYVYLVLRHPGNYPAKGNCLSVDGLTIGLGGKLPPADASAWVLQLQGAPFTPGKKSIPSPRNACGTASVAALAVAE